MNSLKSAARKNSNVYIFDPFDKFCDAKYCYVTRENVSLFIDDNHLSKDGALLISGDLLSMIVNINAKKK